jgi:hypothetical protein
MSKWDAVKGNMRGGAKPPLPFPKCDESASIAGNKKFFETKVGVRKVNGFNELSDKRKEI